MASIFTPTTARLTIRQFHMMGEAGILPPDARVELINGEMLEMAPIGARHLKVVNRLNRLLVSSIRDAAIVSVQNPVVLDDHSEPQPDLAILTSDSDSGTRLPKASDVLLLIEVADTTIQYDRTVKLQLYAKHGIREVWIVNLVDRVLEVYREPKDGGYRVKLDRAASETMSPLALPTVELALAAILGV